MSNFHWNHKFVISNNHLNNLIIFYNFYIHPIVFCALFNLDDLRFKNLDRNNKLANLFNKWTHFLCLLGQSQHQGENYCAVHKFLPFIWFFVIFFCIQTIQETINYRKLNWNFHNWTKCHYHRFIKILAICSCCDSHILYFFLIIYTQNISTKGEHIIETCCCCCMFFFLSLFFFLCKTAGAKYMIGCCSVFQTKTC